MNAHRFRRLSGRAGQSNLPYVIKSPPTTSAPTDRPHSLAIIPSARLRVHSDPGLVGQILRNLVANALKYIQRGGVLIGCQRRGAMLRIGVWDTGLGIAEDDMEPIFEEYHQVGNIARERSLGLGLPIVRRLATLLGHTIHVGSVLGKGSVFTIDVPISTGIEVPCVTRALVATKPAAGVVYVVDDDPA